MRDPIFAPPPPDLTEEWTHGVLIGGMAAETDRLRIAHAYKRAADTLVEAGLRGRDAYAIAYPILFLYRHALELYLKDILRAAERTHDLGALIHALEAHCLRVHHQPLPGWARDRLWEFVEYDRASTAFRYEGRYSAPLQSELWVDLVYLRRVIDALCRGLDRLA